MKNNHIFILAVLLILGVASTGAGEMTKNDDKIIKTKEQILKEFPNLKATDIVESPISGLYEVTAGDNIFYWKDGYVIFGDMFSKEGVSVTAEKRKKIWSTRINRVPLDKAVKIGNGKNVVVEFTDPDCPYCRKVNEYLSKRTDLTRYIFLYPLSQIHKDSANKVAYILSAKDKVLAHDEIYSGKYDKTPTPKQSDVSLKLVEDYISIARTVGIPGTPVLWVNGNFVNGADMQQIAALLDRREEVKKQ